MAWRWENLGHVPKIDCGSSSELCETRMKRQKWDIAEFCKIQGNDYLIDNGESKSFWVGSWHIQREC